MLYQVCVVRAVGVHQVGESTILGDLPRPLSGRDVAVSLLDERLVGVGLLRVHRLQEVPDGRMSVAHHRRELAVPSLHVVVCFIEGAGGAVDQVPGSRREPGRLGGPGGSDPLDPGSLEV